LTWLVLDVTSVIAFAGAAWGKQQMATDIVVQLDGMTASYDMVQQCGSDT